jgi:hypothetical protein
MAFWSKWFSPAAPEPKPGTSAEYKGYAIAATPFKDNGQYQLCGVIAKDIDGVRKEHRFIRADRFASIDDANDIALSKARQIIDEQGDRIFG